MEVIMGYFVLMQKFGKVVSFGQPCMKTPKILSEDVGHVRANVAQELQGRMPDDVTAEGDGAVPPRIVVLVDDYDLLTTAGQQPLAPFLPFVAGGRDIGLHFVVTRRVAGASRGMYDPLVQAMCEIGTGALVMSGDRSEGQLFPRVHAGPQPPGRGLWLRRGEAPQLIQTAVRHEPPDAPEPQATAVQEAR
jgi:S-DNA-T family DNA segregation ATPase FtsK/SpoIIIE